MSCWTSFGTRKVWGRNGHSDRALSNCSFSQCTVLELPLSDLLKLEADDSPEFRRGCGGVFKDFVGVVSGMGWMASLAGGD